MHAQQVWVPSNRADRSTAENITAERSAEQSTVEWVTFQRQFPLAAAPAGATLNLFAGSRYRLSVNGQIVAYGPARFVPSYAEYATFDLRPYLRAGDNTIEVEACFINANNYQHVPDTTGRFIAWGSVTAGQATVDLSTPGQWLGGRASECVSAVPSYSFAIGPIEARDTRQPAPTFGPVQLLNVAADEWNFVPASVPGPTDQILQPTLLRIATLTGGERRIGFISLHPTSRSGHSHPTRGERFRYLTCLHSPREQTITLGLHWGPHFLNGQPVEAKDDAHRKNRQNATVTLRAGWNLLCGEPEQLQPIYPLLVGLPTNAGVTAHARPDVNEPSPMAYCPPRAIAEADKWSTQAPTRYEAVGVDGTWKLAAPEPPPLPARMMAWDQPDPTKAAAALPFSSDGEYTAVFDIGTEFLAHPRVELDAPAGTIVDVGYDEKLRDDGCLAWFSSNPFIESADQFVCRGGRQTFETFYPRGGRFLQVTVRTPAGQKPATLQAVTLRDARCDQPLNRTFKSGDAVLDWTWQACVETLRASADDVFCDSPWRERGMYLGDSYVQAMAELTASTRPTIGPRALRLFAAAQNPDGQFPNVAPSWFRAPLFDFSLIYVLWLHDYWQQTQDLALLRDCLPAVERLLGSRTWITSPHSLLWDVPSSGQVFIDWGTHLPMRKCPENAVLNAFRYRAMQNAATLFAAVGNQDRSQQLSREAEQVRAAFRDRLWLSNHGRFAGGSENGQPIEREIIHANVLALAFGLADEQQEAQLIPYVLQRLAGNAARALSKAGIDDYVELYFLKYALDALVRIGRHDAARQLIIDHMKPMRDANAPTLWECLGWSLSGRGSKCHAWSAGPVIYLGRHVKSAITGEAANG